MQLKIKSKIFFTGFFLVTVIIAELYLRSNSAILSSSEAIRLNDPLVHHDYNPGVTFITQMDKNNELPPVINKINSFGIRGPEISKKKARRVLLLGDSFIQADEVDFKDTFSEKLNNHFDGKLEFIAHGIGSWSPTTEFSWLCHKGIELFPDEVNIFLCANDFYRENVYSMSDVSYQRQALYEGDVPIGYKVNIAEGQNSLFAKIKKTLKKIHIIRWIHERLKLIIFKITYRIFHKEQIVSDLADEVVLFSRDAALWPEDLQDSVDSTVEVIYNIKHFLEQ
ncbi:MAG: hypothetical protein HQ579_01500, partial [Candidatus Omnitrophica bacterium]|nr:hypothetical protein [Candidatus Omnitrophota bacterium]